MYSNVVQTHSYKALYNLTILIMERTVRAQEAHDVTPTRLTQLASVLKNVEFFIKANL